MKLLPLLRKPKLLLLLTPLALLGAWAWAQQSLSTDQLRVGDSSQTVVTGSAAVGYQNFNMGGSTLSVGFNNSLYAQRAAAVGTGNYVSSSDSLTVGRYNDNTHSPNYLFAVGNGTSAASADRKTAFAVLSDGRVILGQAQGVIPSVP